MSSTTAVFLAVLLLFGNAFFVASEFALVSARRSQIEPRAEEGNRFARTTLRAMEHMSLVIGVNQLGITVCSLVLGAVAEPTAAHLLEPPLTALGVPESFVHPIAFAVGLAVVVYLHVVLGEMIPEEHRPGRPGPRRAGARHPDLGDRLGDPARDHRHQRPRLRVCCAGSAYASWTR